MPGTETYLATVDAMRRGGLRPLKSLMGRGRSETEMNETTQVAASVLQAMPLRDREALDRFFLQGQSPETICREMQLSHSQFAAIRTGARQQFEERRQTGGRRRA